MPANELTKLEPDGTIPRGKLQDVLTTNWLGFHSDYKWNGMIQKGTGKPLPWLKTGPQRGGYPSDWPPRSSAKCPSTAGHSNLRLGGLTNKIRGSYNIRCSSQSSMSSTKASDAPSYYQGVIPYYNLVADDSEPDDAEMPFSGIFAGANSFGHNFWGTAVLDVD